MEQQKEIMKKIRIGTRGSKLALWQADFVQAEIEKHFPEVIADQIIIHTEGDRDQASSLTQIGGQGVFTKAIEQALLDNEIDIAVHSLKDLPSVMPDELELGAVPARGIIYDVFIGRDGIAFKDLPEGARVASGSIRRRAQLKQIRPDLNLMDLRGNIQTRLRKLQENDLHGIIMAEAALVRLKLDDVKYERFTMEQMLPAVGQGALGIQVRKSDKSLAEVLEILTDKKTFAEITAERAFLRTLDSGCQFPVAAHAAVIGDVIELTGLVAAENGSTILKEKISGQPDDADHIGCQLAEELIRRGALDLLSGV